MKLPLVFKIALRYLWGKGTANAVPILSKISIAAIAISSCAMIILFSVFNGFSALIEELYKAFYPPIKITAKNAKYIDNPDSIIVKIKQLKGIQYYTKVLEDNVLINTDEGDYLPVSILGVDSQYMKVTQLKPYIVKGNTQVQANPVLANCIIGQDIANQLGIDVDNVFSRIMVYAPNPNIQPANINPTNAFYSALLKPDGAFAVQEEFDAKYVIAPLENVALLLNKAKAVTSIELSIQPHSSADAVKEQLQQILGNKYQIATRYEQNKTVYMVAQTEKWAGFLILVFVLLIASFNMVSALSLLVLEKQKDLGILQTMGLQPSQLSKIILLEGGLWGFCGGLIGLFIGLALCWGQQHYAWVKLQGNFLIEAYPVQVKLFDIVVVLITVSIVGCCAALYPSKLAAAALKDNHLRRQ